MKKLNGRPITAVNSGTRFPRESGTTASSASASALVMPVSDMTPVDHVCRNSRPGRLDNSQGGGS
jgi:hypothetical protein